MVRLKKLLLFIALPCVVIVGAAVAYEFFVGFPRKFEGRLVHRRTAWSPEHTWERARIYYVYTDPAGKEVRNGPFENFSDGHLIQQAYYRDGKLDGPMIFWNLFGEKTQEVYYRWGAPYGWANYSQEKLISLRQEISQDGRSVAVKTFENGRYTLEFKCGELVNLSVDPATGQTAPVPNANQRACAKP